MEVLRTERLALRHFTTEDIDDLTPILGDPEVMRFSLRGPADREGVSRAIESYRSSYAAHGYGRWAVIELGSGDLLGFCGIGLMPVDGIATPELGYRLRPQSWGKGYATEAARACLDHAFGELDLERVIAVIEPANIGSIRVAEKTGFRFDRETIYEGVDVRIYACDRPKEEGPLATYSR